MLNFDVKRSSRKCSKADRTLEPGEEFFSALVDVDGTTERLDFCEESWEGPPENCIGWWKCKIPELGKGKVYWAPRNVLVSYFEHVNGQPGEADTAYVTALLLVQKRILSLKEECLDEEETQFLLLKNRKDNQSYQVPVVEVSPERLAQIQNELAERLFMDRPAESADEDGGDGVKIDAE